MDLMQRPLTIVATNGFEQTPLTRAAANGFEQRPLTTEAAIGLLQKSLTVTTAIWMKYCVFSLGVADSGMSTLLSLPSLLLL